MKYLHLLLSDFIFDLSREKTDEFSNLLRTYSNKDLSDQDKIMLFGATTAFLIQTSCKRLTKNEADENELAKKTLLSLKDSIEKNGGKKSVVDFVEDIMNSCKEKLAEQKNNSIPVFYTSSIALMSIDVTMVENYIKELIAAVENIYESVEKVHHELKT